MEAARLESLVARREGATAAVGVADGRFDLDDIGAKVAQDRGRIRGRYEVAAFENA